MNIEASISFALGSWVRIRAIFADSNGTRTDPTGVFFRWKAQYTGVGTTITYAAGTDPRTEIVRESSGVYYTHVDTTNLPGNMWWWWYSTGDGQAAEDGTFYVRPART